MTVLVLLKGKPSDMLEVGYGGGDKDSNHLGLHIDGPGRFILIVYGHALEARFNCADSHDSNEMCRTIREDRPPKSGLYVRPAKSRLGC